MIKATGGNVWSPGYIQPALSVPTIPQPRKSIKEMIKEDMKGEKDIYKGVFLLLVTIFLVAFLISTFLSITTLAQTDVVSSLKSDTINSETPNLLPFPFEP
jgi:hypothetical protein